MIILCNNIAMDQFDCITLAASEEQPCRQVQTLDMFCENILLNENVLGGERRELVERDAKDLAQQLYAVLLQQRALR